MAQESGSQNKNMGFVEFIQKYQAYILVAAFVVLAIIYFIVANNNKDDQPTDQANNGQNSSQQQPTDSNANQNQNGTQDSGSNTANGQTQGAQTEGNVSAAGTLMASDNASRGNLMVQSSSGNIYIATKRDFSSLVGKPVTLQADGTLNKFTFLGFKEAVASAPAPADNGTSAGTNVTFMGTLRASDNSDMGNYILTSGNAKVYLQTAHDYVAWVGQDVTLHATGTLNSFSNASLSK